MKHLHILIIEDDPDIIEDLPRVLTTYEMDCVSTSDSTEAIMRVERGGLDCIVLDLKMPPSEDMTDDETDGGRLTGLIVCRRIRAFDRSIPILVLTSISDISVHSMVLQAGANKIMCKPQYPDEIVNTIRAMTRSVSA